MYVHQKEEYFDPKVRRYPLYLISSHSRYRMQSWQDADPMLNTDVYRHSIWISAVDAALSIAEGDLVRVYSEVGEAMLPAYITHKIVPGTILIWEGG
ncbi:MAG: molybdopterin dinucleotide binding domain-containing protein [Nitrososphaeria archaeon]